MNVGNAADDCVGVTRETKTEMGGGVEGKIKEGRVDEMENHKHTQKHAPTHTHTHTQTNTCCKYCKTDMVSVQQDSLSKRRRCCRSHRD